MSTETDAVATVGQLAKEIKTAGRIFSATRRQYKFLRLRVHLCFPQDIRSNDILPKFIVTLWEHLSTANSSRETQIWVWEGNCPLVRVQGRPQWAVYEASSVKTECCSSTPVNIETKEHFSDLCSTFRVSHVFSLEQWTQCSGRSAHLWKKS